MEVTKEYVVRAFNENWKRKLQLLYVHYRDALFKEDLPANYLSERISEDLGINISIRAIYQIKHKYVGKEYKTRRSNEKESGSIQEKHHSSAAQQTVKIDNEDYTFSGPEPYRNRVLDQLQDHLKENHKKE
jgi:hypothetical protein